MDEGPQLVDLFHQELELLLLVLSHHHFPHSVLLLVLHINDLLLQNAHLILNFDESLLSPEVFVQVVEFLFQLVYSRLQIVIHLLQVHVVVIVPHLIKFLLCKLVVPDHLQVIDQLLNDLVVLHGVELSHRHAHATRIDVLVQVQLLHLSHPVDQVVFHLGNILNVSVKFVVHFHKDFDVVPQSLLYLQRVRFGVHNHFRLDIREHIPLERSRQIRRSLDVVQSFYLEMIKDITIEVLRSSRFFSFSDIKSPCSGDLCRLLLFLTSSLLAYITSAFTDSIFP